MPAFEESAVLIDGITPILNRIYQQAYDTAQAMESMKQSSLEPFVTARYDELSQKLTSTNQELAQMVGNFNATQVQVTNLQEANKELTDMVKQLEDLRRKQEEANKGWQGFKANITSINQGLQLAQQVWNGITTTVGHYVDAANEAIASNTRLETIARHASGATAEQVEHLKDVAGAYSKITTFSQSALTAGLSELATYRMSAEALEAMTGTLADYAAGQAGINANAWNITQLANQLGKAFDGNYGGLTKIGFVFSDAQKAILDTGTEMEKIAVLQEVIGESYGGLAEAMAATPEGQIIALNNAWAKIDETIGNKLLPSVAIFSQAQSNLASAFNPEVASGFYDAIAIGAMVAANIISAPINAISWFMNLMNQGNEIARRLFIVAIGASVAFATNQVWGLIASTGILKLTNIQAAISAASAWIAAAAPFIGIGIAIAAVITILSEMGVTAEDIAGFIGGAFKATADGIMFAFDKVANFFIWIANKASEFGAKFGIGDGKQFEYKDIKDYNFEESWNEGDEAGRKAFNEAMDLLNNPGAAEDPFGGTGGGGIEEIPYVGEVGKINEPVNLSAEDMKYILDERERQYMANVNLSVPAPVLNLKIENVNSEEDLDSFLNKAGRRLREMAEANIVIVPE